MKQQINLYQLQFHERKVVLPAKKIALTLCCLLVLITISSISLVWLNSSNTVEKNKMETRLAALKAENKTMSSKLEVQTVDSALEASVNNAAKQLRSRQRIMQWVNDSQSDTAVRFSELLEGLGRQHITGLWLSYVDIFNGGNDLNLHGSTLKPEFLPDLIGRLSQESAFVGREFRRVKMQERDVDSNIIDFALTTEKHGEKEMQVALGASGRSGK